MYQELFFSIENKSCYVVPLKETNKFLIILKNYKMKFKTKHDFV